MCILHTHYLNKFTGSAKAPRYVQGAAEPADGRKEVRANVPKTLSQGRVGFSQDAARLHAPRTQGVQGRWHYLAPRKCSGTCLVRCEQLMPIVDTSADTQIHACQALAAAGKLDSNAVISGDVSRSRKEARHPERSCQAACKGALKSQRKDAW